MRLNKTEKARAELAASRGALTPRERSLLLLADGRRAASDLLGLVRGADGALIDRLRLDGYLTGPKPLPAASGPTRDGGRFVRGAAATKMFLLDLCERSFARAEQVQFERLRDQLRAAADEDSLADAAEQLLDALAALAGADRAEAVRNQLFATTLEPA